MRRRALAPLLLLLWACGSDLPRGEPLELARSLPASQAARLFLERRLSSRERGQAAVILTARFGEAALPWLTAALSRFPVSAWPDRFHVARSLRALSTPAARDLLLRCLGDPTDESLRAEAARALAPWSREPAVSEALAAAAAADPSPLVREEAGALIGR